MYMYVVVVNRTCSCLHLKTRTAKDDMSGLQSIFLILNTTFNQNVDETRTDRRTDGQQPSIRPKGTNALKYLL